MLTNPETVWPEGVIARYLTVAGATVDLWYDSGTLRAKCGGERCRWTGYESTEVFYTDTDEVRDQKIDDALPGLQRQAQSHAEKCRALPRPAVTA
ncbi:hypothetical protein [Streptomyces sp. FZ201]|uniref:hypothetical protein n=1 Tax=Streptomyces sp. FZ201 TaxID=3057122 RepID=UPI0021C1ADAF|nr:hypothetical protein [Streptomyces sp. FZ201]